MGEGVRVGTRFTILISFWLVVCEFAEAKIA